MTDKKSAPACLALLMVSIIWGGGFVAGKMALTGLTPFAILAWRFGLAAILCGILFRGKILRTPGDTIRKGCIIGAVQMTALSIQLIGLQYTTSAKQSFLCTAYVAMVPFISWFILHKKPGTKAFLAGFFSLAGIGLISLNGPLSIGLGDSLSLGFALLFGIQIVLVGKYVGAETDSFQLSFFQFVSAGVLALLISLIRGDSLHCTGTEALAGVAYLVILNTVVAFLVQNMAQKYTSDTVASLILSLESVFGFLFSVLYYHDQPGIRLLTGSMLCFGAILLNSWTPARK